MFTNTTKSMRSLTASIFANVLLRIEMRMVSSNVLLKAAKMVMMTGPITG